MNATVGANSKMHLQAFGRRLHENDIKGCTAAKPGMHSILRSWLLSVMVLKHPPCARPSIRAWTDSRMTRTVAMDMMTAQTITETVSKRVRPTGNCSKHALCMSMLLEVRMWQCAADMQVEHL